MREGNGNGSSKATVIGTMPKVAKAGHREDYILRVLAPTRKTLTPRIELRVFVNNQVSSPPFEGLTSKGGYFAMDLLTFKAMVAMAPEIETAYLAATPQAGQEVQQSAIPEGPNLELLGNVTTVR